LFRRAPLALVDAAIVALDTGETEIARAQLQALTEACEPVSRVAGETALEERSG